MPTWVPRIGQDLPEIERLLACSGDLTCTPGVAVSSSCAAGGEQDFALRGVDDAMILDLRADERPSRRPGC